MYLLQKYFKSAGKLCQTFPAQAVDLLHDLADFLFHALACLAFGRELHEADFGPAFTEVDFPFLFRFIFGDADAVFRKTSLILLPSCRSDPFI